MAKKSASRKGRRLLPAVAVVGEVTAAIRRERCVEPPLKKTMTS
jgi:hypothetical protein